MSKQILSELENTGLERSPLDEFLPEPTNNRNEERTSRSTPKAEDKTNEIVKSSEHKMGRPRTRVCYKHCSLDLPQDLYDTLRAESFQRCEPMNTIIITALEAFFKQDYSSAP